MNTMSEGQFLHWASTKSLRLNPQYPQSAVLDFQTDCESRFWEVPREPERRPYFLASLIDLMGDWKTCYAWRHLGSWPDPAHVQPGRINDVVEMLVLKGLRVPLGTGAYCNSTEANASRWSRSCSRRRYSAGALTKTRTSCPITPGRSFRRITTTSCMPRLRMSPMCSAG
jgi:hypothetical protein